jgi:hypothetical protein
MEADCAVSAGVLLQPGEHVAGVSVGREDRIEDFGDAAVVDHHGQTLDQRQACHLHGGKAQHVGERQLLVREQREGQVETLGRFALIGAVLARQAEHACGAGFEQHLMQIAECAALRGAAPRPGYHVPVVDERDLAGLAGARIGEHHHPAGDLGEGNL